jgi:hypothetical protein
MSLVSTIVPQNMVKERGYSGRVVALSSNYSLEVLDVDKSSLGFLAMAYQPKAREFKSLDSIARKAKELGFKDVILSF